MALQPTHELHKRRLGRNFGVAGLLLAFVVLVFVLTMVKIQRGEPVQGFDHIPASNVTAPVITGPEVTAPEVTAPEQSTTAAAAATGDAAP